MRKRTKTERDDINASGPGGALVRGLTILKAFGPVDSTLGNQELLERTGLPKASISRLTATLVKHGYLHYDRPSGRYSIGAATISLGYGAVSSNPVVHVAKPMMQKLSDHTGASVALGSRSGLEMVYYASCSSTNPASLQLGVGSRIPIWRTAMGLAYIANMTSTAREKLIDDIQKSTPESYELSKYLIERSVHQYNERGFVSIFGDWYSYINTVGVAFQPTDGSPMMAITCGAIVDILSKEQCMNVVGPLLREMRDNLQKVLNGEVVWSAP